MPDSHGAKSIRQDYCTTSFTTSFTTSSVKNLHRQKFALRLTKGAEGAGEEVVRPEVSGDGKWRFPLKAGVTSGGLVLLGDTAAQFFGRYQRIKSAQDYSVAAEKKNVLVDETFWQHDWKRALRMGGYGFLCYGPLSYGWYNLLDHLMPVKNFSNFVIKVALNQLVLGPIVVSIVFSWNALFTNRLPELPRQLQRHALPTLIDGWKFWTPVTFLNFGLVPLDARVAFMSSCAVFWNFYLSTAVSKKAA
ncbi:hypothetical protein R1sor_020327 [Riccia sorocarpa]|uniref:Uncharacterized protein n=1 Tax=Riccia sorocarpa TaxID=122646 RepID=A0ABD3IIV3_9MARC